MESTTDLKPTHNDRDDRELEQHRPADDQIRKTLLAGLLGAVTAAAGYFIYTRLEDEQKEALRQSLGKFVEDKIADVRSQLKF